MAATFPPKERKSPTQRLLSVSNTMSRCVIFDTGTRIRLYLVLIIIYYRKKMIFVGIGLKFGGFFLLGVSEF